MSAFDNYLRISAFLDGYLSKEILLAVPGAQLTAAERGPHGEETANYSFLKDALYQSSSGTAAGMLCRALNIRELAFISEKVEEYLIENGY
jgi:hypothetical protein